MYSIGEFAEKIGRSVNTLRRWDSDGRLKAHRAKSGHRYYTENQLRQYRGLSTETVGKTVAYTRVSSRNQKDDLTSQKQYISDFCTASGISVDEWIEDVGSGLNYNRKGLNKLMDSIVAGEITSVIIAHPDRFVRFGFDWFRNFCSKFGCKFLVINDERLSPEQEIVQDLVSIIHVFSCRVYGLRKYKTTIQKEL